MPPTKTSTPQPTPRASADPETFRLDHFMPYRLAVLAAEISDCVGRAYRERFGLTVQEWRVLVNLGHHGAPRDGQDAGLCANDVARHTALDKVQVSRTISRMIDGGLVSRTIDAADRRRTILTLTTKGQDLLAQIVPAAVAYEQRLLATLSDEEYACLDRLILRLRDSAAELDQQA